MINNEQIPKKRESEQPEKPSESDSESKEYAKTLLAKMKEKGVDIFRRSSEFAKGLEAEFGRERLIKNPYFHVLVGSTTWPGLRLEEDEEISARIKGFIDKL